MKSTLPPLGEVQRSRAASAEHITFEQMNYSPFFIFLGNNSHIQKLKYAHADSAHYPRLFRFHVDNRAPPHAHFYLWLNFEQV